MVLRLINIKYQSFRIQSSVQKKNKFSLAGFADLLGWPNGQQEHSDFSTFSKWPAKWQASL